MKKLISPKLQTALDAFDATPLTVGEKVQLKGKTRTDVTVIEINGESFVGRYNGRSDKAYSLDEIEGRYGRLRVGANPFHEDNTRIDVLPCSLETILFRCGYDNNPGKWMQVRKNNLYGNGVNECSDNPFVINSAGEKEYFQRGLVWDQEQKVSLIDSIYQGVEIGRVLLRIRKYEEAEEYGIPFNDIIDGKQRINAIASFLKDEFQDSQGNLFSDLSFWARNKIKSYMGLGYAEMKEPTDEQVIRQFLKLNFSGVPMSKDHLDWVKSINVRK